MFKVAFNVNQIKGQMLPPNELPKLGGFIQNNVVRISIYQVWKQVKVLGNLPNIIKYIREGITKTSKC